MQRSVPRPAARIVAMAQSANDAAAKSGAALTVPTGGSFGELALMYFAPRAATLTANQPSKLWVIDRKQFKDILAKSSDELQLENASDVIPKLQGV